MSATPAETAAGAPRKPRLTDGVLEDLPEALASIQADIDYLRDAVPGFPKASALHTRMAQRLSALERSHAWLAGFREAVIAQRQQGLPEDPRE
jgi:hypothetical protein